MNLARCYGAVRDQPELVAACRAGVAAAEATPSGGLAGVPFRLKADESIAASKGRGLRTPPKPFPCKWGISWDRDGGQDGDHGPSGRHPAGAALPNLSWAKAMPPLWQYFSRLLLAILGSA